MNSLPIILASIVLAVAAIFIFRRILMMKQAEYKKRHHAINLGELFEK